MRNSYAEKSWDTFNKLLQQTQPLNGAYHKIYAMLNTPVSDLTMPFLLTGGKLGFYYKEHEILPPLPGQILIFPPIKLLVLDTKLTLPYSRSY